MSNKKPKAEIQFSRDMAMVFLSIVMAVIVAKTGVLKEFLYATSQSQTLGSFIGGLFFTSIFTTAPAIVILAELAQVISPWKVATIGAVGALFVDLLIFRFIKNNVDHDIQYLLKKYHLTKTRAVFRSPLVRWVFPFLGALIIASPLPDELGIALMGIGKLNPKYFVPISFSLNFLGILVIGLVARRIAA